jgi:hypothetical protein
MAAAVLLACPAREAPASADAEPPAPLLVTDLRVERIEGQEQGNQYAIEFPVVFRAGADGESAAGEGPFSKLNRRLRAQLEARLDELLAHPCGSTFGCALTTSVERFDNGFGALSFVVSEDMFTGGAHPATWWTAVNVDLDSGEELTWRVAFGSDGLQDVQDRIEEIVAADPDLYYPNAQVDLQQAQFYFEGDHVVVFFEPYSLGPRRQAFSLPLAQLGRSRGRAPDPAATS